MKFWKIIRDLIPYAFIVFLVIIIRTYIAKIPLRGHGYHVLGRLVVIE